MAADCNCSNPSCPCYKGNQDKAGEQPAPGPNAAGINEWQKLLIEEGVAALARGDIEGGDALLNRAKNSNTSPRNKPGAATAQGTDGHNTHGGTMTAPASGNGNSGGGDIMSVQDMRNHWQQAGTTAAGTTDPLNSVASQLKERAARMEAVQAHAAQHGDETASQAAAAAETYRALAQKCDEAAAAVEPAIAGCAAAEQGLERFRPTEEALSGLPNRHEQTAAYVGS